MLSDSELIRIQRDVEEAVKEAGAFIKSNYGVNECDIQVKEKNSLVTYVDKEAEHILVSRLSEILPTAGFITEEDTPDNTEHKDFVWIIDPLDGTTNFIYQIPFFAVSVALFDYQRNGLLGVVYEVMGDELFSARQGGGTWLNGVRRVTSSKTLDRALLATGFPYSNFSDEQAYLALFQRLTKASRGIRRIGAAALDLAYVSVGRFDGFFEYNLHIWDIAAGFVLVREAGGMATDLRGGDDWWSGKSVLTAGSAGLHAELLKLS